VQVDVLLDLVHDQVVVSSFPAERDAGELAGAVAIDQEDLGGQVGAVVTCETLRSSAQVKDSGTAHAGRAHGSRPVRREGASRRQETNTSRSW
jgi:hypothetical protein